MLLISLLLLLVSGFVDDEEISLVATGCETNSLLLGRKLVPRPLSEEFGDNPPMEPPEVEPVEVELPTEV